MTVLDKEGEEVELADFRDAAMKGIAEMLDERGVERTVAHTSLTLGVVYVGDAGPFVIVEIHGPESMKKHEVRHGR